MVKLGSANAQQQDDCSILAPGSDAGFDQLGFCAPVTGRVKYFTFYTLKAVPRTALQVEINWGMGKKRYGGANDINQIDSLGYDENLKAYVYRMREATFEYGPDRANAKCSYPVTVQAVVNNKLCSTPKQSGTVIVWDKDNANGGSLLLNPTKYYVCAGSEVEVNFEDNSSWNCTPPKEKSHFNWPSRTTQFVYGTQNTITGGVKVGNQIVTDNPLEGDLKEYEEKAQGPSAPYNKTATIIIPATAKVGERFEVTLNNWNYCNPLADGNDPIQERAIIEVVAQPKAEITITNKKENEKEAFCPNEEVQLHGSYSVGAGIILPEDVRYDWEIVDVASGEIQKIHNKQIVILPAGFPKPGQQLVRLKVTNLKVSGAACASVEEQYIELIDAPSVSSSINGVAGNKLDICAGDLGQLNFTAAFSHTMGSNEDFTYTYQLYKRNSTANSPDSLEGEAIKSGAGVKLLEKADVYTATFTQPGRYRVRVVARNNATGCSTVEENTVSILEDPLSDFSTEGYCAGLTTTFVDKSKASSVPGDKIKSWEWDMNYTSENQASGTFDADKTGKGKINWTFQEAGLHVVALKVTNHAGCSSIKVDTLELMELPVAKLGNNYAGGLVCTGDTIRFSNESFSLNPASRFPAGVSYTLHISDSVATKEIPLQEGQQYVDYSNFYNPNDSVETYTVWLRAQANEPNTCAIDSKPVLVKVRSGAAAGYLTIPTYSPFEPNCSPKTIRFATNKATRELQADRYTWTVLLDGKIIDEISRERGGEAAFDTLDYAFKNTSFKYLDYQLVLSAEKEGICIIPAINTYRIYPNPWAQFSAEPVLQACDSAVFELKVNLPAGISDYQWSFSEEPSNAAEAGVMDGDFYVAYNRPAYGEAPKEYTITLSATNFYGCVGEWTEKVVVNPVVVHEPVLELAALEGNGCRPLKASFKNLTVGDSAKATYELYIENVATASLQKVEPGLIEGNLKNAFSYTFLESGKFKVYLKVSAEIEGGECVRSLSEGISIEVKKDPVATFEVYPKEACGSLDAMISGRKLDSDFRSWIVSDVQTGEVIYSSGKTAAADDTFVRYTLTNETSQTKNYQIKLIAENAAGCSTADSVQLTVFAEPKPYFNIKTDACEPFVVEVEHQTAGNAADMQYTWIWGDGTTSEGKNPPAHTYRNDSYSRPLHYNLRLVATSANGCTADSSMRVIVHPKVKADFDADVLKGCAPLAVNFTNRSLGAVEDHSGWYIKEAGAADYAFVGSTMLHYVFENKTAQQKVFSVMYKAGNAGGCADSVVKEITVQPAVGASFTVAPGTEVYSNQKIKFVNTNRIPGVEYTWNWGDGSAPLKSGAAEVTHRYPNTSEASKFYEVTLTAHNTTYGCTSSSKQLIIVYPAIRLSLTPKKDTLCLPEVPEFILQKTNVSNGYWYAGVKGQVDYSRQLSDVYDATLFTNTTGNPLTYEVIYVGTTAQGHKDSISSEVVVYPALPPSFTLDGLHKSLPNAAYQLTNTTPNADKFTTTWDFGDGKEMQKTQPGSYTYNTYGAFTITMTISNGFCSESYSMNVQVDDAAPQLSFSMEQTEGCWPVTVNFTNTSEYTDEEAYFWDFGDGVGTSTAINPSYTYNKPGIYHVTLHAYNRTATANGSITAEEVVRVYPKPTADFVVRKEQVYVPEEPVYVANYSERGVWYQWDFGDGTIYEGADQFEPVHYYQQPGTYTIKLLVRSEQGCMDSVVVERAVRAVGGGEVKMANAFTPNTSGPNGGHINGGGQNDVFHPHIKGGVTSYRFQIFNRWGELVFSTNDVNQGWDGYYKGRLCNSDTYIYKISAELNDGKTINKIGDVLLIR
ncbi:T9SS C-terminal target domain-containing protein [Nafulsella turpanensis]|uniref:T9SS C-terminal target domain-containing protein n=1 Tax=Nafulsella turpanensis TaxID=1265690 RepID=UPI000344B6EC|nr:T9SS C-terminal target domain-containing protein [Nafulsella turpanensis]